MITSEKLNDIFNMSTGTENYYLMRPLKQKYTDGVKEVAERASASWLISDICVILTALKRTDFTSIKLFVKDGKARLLFTDGNYGKLYEQKYNYTDFPEGEWGFFYVDGVLMLSTEY